MYPTSRRLISLSSGGSILSINSLVIMTWQLAHTGPWPNKSSYKMNVQDAKVYYDDDDGHDSTAR